MWIWMREIERRFLTLRVYTGKSTLTAMKRKSNHEKKISFYSKLFRKCWGGTNTINLHTASKSLNHSLKTKEMNNQKNHRKIKEKGERTRAFWAATSSTSEENPRIHLECCKSSASSRPLLSSLHLTPPPPLPPLLSLSRLTAIKAPDRWIVAI